jgi:hypothetical protein
MLRIPRCLDNRLTVGGEAVSPTQLPSSTPQKHFFFQLSVLISTVFARSNTEIVGSNPTGGMDVCVCSVCVYSVST